MTDIPEPTSLNSVVVGKRNGDTVIAARLADFGRKWAVRYPGVGYGWRFWPELGAELTDIRVVDMDEIAAKPEPGPWLRGDELAALMPTLKADDVVEAGYKGNPATGKLWPGGSGRLYLWGFTVRGIDGKPGPYVDALRIIERAPEPGAYIPDEVVKAAVNEWRQVTGTDREAMRAALAAADAKRAELEGEA